MKWGFFSVIHIISLLLVVIINVGLYYILKNMSNKNRLILLGILSFSGIVAIIYNLLMWGSPLEYLPLHLCSLNAIILPIAVFSKNKVIGNVLLVWCLGAVFALIMNNSQIDTEIFSWTFFFYYFPHVFELGIPIILFKLKWIKKDISCIFSTLGITIIIYTIIHFINISLNNYFIRNQIVDYNGNLIQVNYMFSIIPSNPLLELFYKIIPYQYWYMYLVFPIVIVYLLIIYLPELKQILKNKRAN